MIIIEITMYNRMALLNIMMEPLYASNLPHSYNKD
jgi:hypothetical protein